MENVFGENTKKLGFGMMRLPELATSGKFGNGGLLYIRRLYLL